MVRLLSKLPAANEPKEAMLNRYYQGLRDADDVVRQIKLADRAKLLRSE